MRKVRPIAHPSFLTGPLVALLLASLLALSGCFGISKEPQVAATANGEPIYEADVTDFIEGFRTKNSQYETDTGWAEFLRSNGFTPESMRSYVINTVFIPKALIRQECLSRSIQVTDAELDDIIAREKDYYEQRYGENSWHSVLASFGYDEDSWRQNELDRLLEEQLTNSVITNPTPNADEIQSMANQTAANYSGKSTYFIEFDTLDQALAAREKVSSPTPPEAFSALGSPVYAGWNSLSAYRDSMSKEYIQAADELELGDVSNPVESEGKWLLIYCNAVYSVSSDGGPIDLGAIPKEIYDQIVADARVAKAESLFDEWLEKLAGDSEIDIVAMPDGIPYNVNVSIED